MLICFIGIDGSGKTTYSKKLQSSLNKYYSCEYLHFDTIFAGNLMNIIAKIDNPNKNSSLNDITSYSEKNKRGFLKLFSMYIWALVLLLDDFIFYIKKLLFRRRSVIICDRFFYDTAITLTYSGVKASLVFFIYQKVFPKPDLVIFMDIEPIIAYNRKKEDSLDYLKEKRELYNYFFLNFCNEKIKVNTDDDFEDTYRIIKLKVEKMLV
jgi:thymidylate kinase